ncbi:MAG: 2Fe-2S iron-sulfur cluster binding domain-containing protein [Woeseiaceae bacterium]|jgi:nicotinate dehydrogenase subunit A|nr:2Fe-2S iron-sulfur cluster binding domain-containing protein [Woeseiaceae bacterium]
MTIDFKLNGADVSIDVDPRTPLLEVLRNDLELNGPKFGCGLAQCGACAVLLDGTSLRSCVLPVQSVAGKEITTLEGLGTESSPHPLQAAFIELQALQCGYCASGIITTAAAFLEESPSPTDDEIKQALSGHLCRCGAQPRMVKAVARAAGRMRGDKS